VPAPLGKLIAQQVKVPVIGIGAGADVDGQVLVIHDLIGLFDRFVPKFVKQYTNVRGDMLSALRQYRSEVQHLSFPGPEHTFSMSDEAFGKLKKMMKK
jgi:3-methyl-2-oxobutanoate hydroxymethyltransferase